MKRLPTLWILNAGIALLSACLPDPLEVDDVPVPERQVVIASQLVPDQFIAVSLTRNFDALTAGPGSNLDSVLQSMLISDVEITLTANGIDHRMIELERGIYGIDDIPQAPGTRYALSFINPFNADTTVAEATALEYVGFSDVRPVLEYTEFDSLLHVQFSIEDPPGPNWYMINVQDAEKAFDLSERPFTHLFDDEGTDGTMLEDDFTVFFRDFTEEDAVLITLANISPEYYDFLELRGNRRFLSLDALGEPVQYPTNVINGQGFFNVHVPDIRLFLLSEL